MRDSNTPDFKKYIGLRLIVPLCVLIFGGCTHLYYMPATQNVPLFQEKHEFNGSVSVGMGTISSATDIQAAFSFTDHIALMSNFMYSKLDSWDTDDPNKGNITYFEGAAGYFKPFNNFWIFEIYGGLGTCSQNHEYYAWPDDIYRGRADLHSGKIFLQPSIGVKFRAFNIALSSAFSRLNFNKINNYVDQTSLYHDELDMMDGNRVSFLFEPAVTVRAGWENAKVQLQYLVSTNLSNDYSLFEPNKLSLGVYFTLSKKK
jgi:hypothetical protein